MWKEISPDQITSYVRSRESLTVPLGISRVMLGFRQQKGGGFRCTCKCCNSGGNTAAAARARAAQTSSWSGQTGNAKARRSARCRRTAIEMASNSSRTSDFGQNGVLLLPLFRPLYVHVDQEIDLPSNPEAGGDLGGCLERCFSSTPWNSSPRRRQRRYAIHRNQVPKLPSALC